MFDFFTELHGIDTKVVTGKLSAVFFLDEESLIFEEKGKKEKLLLLRR